MSDETQLLQEKIGIDLQFILDCLAEVLLELGEGDVAAIIPWRIVQLPVVNATNQECVPLAFAVPAKYNC